MRQETLQQSVERIAAKEEAAAKAQLFATRRLLNAGIRFLAYNQGHHFVIDRGGYIVDFWPASGKWRCRNWIPTTPTRTTGLNGVLGYIATRERKDDR